MKVYIVTFDIDLGVEIVAVYKTDRAAQDAATLLNTNHATNYPRQKRYPYSVEECDLIE